MKALFLCRSRPKVHTNTDALVGLRFGLASKSMNQKKINLVRTPAKRFRQLIPAKKFEFKKCLQSTFTCRVQEAAAPVSKATSVLIKIC